MFRTFSLNRIALAAVAATLCCVLFVGCSAKSDDSGKQTAPAVTTAENLNSGSNYVASRTESYYVDTLPELPESQTSKLTESKVTSAAENSGSPVSQSSAASAYSGGSTNQTETSSLSGSSSSGKPNSGNSSSSTKAKDEPIEVVPLEKVDNSLLLLEGLPADVREVYDRIASAVDNRLSEVRFDHEEIPQQWVEESLLLLSFARTEETALSSRYIVSVDTMGYVTRLKLEYTKTEQQSDKEKRELKEAVRKIAEGCKTSDEYKIVEYIHDKIVTGCTYDPNGENILSAYGCLVEGKAVCEGYAKAFTLLCGELGIECVPVIGTTAGSGGTQEAHMWNLVKIEGSWYHFDATWDDPITDLGDDFFKYDYFGLSDAKIAVDHTVSEIPYFTYPSANSENGGYFYRNGLSVPTAKKAAEVIKNEVVRAVSSDKRFVRVQVTDDSEFEKLTSMLFEADETGTKEIFRILSKAYDLAGNEKFNPRRYSKLPTNSDKNVLTIILSYE